MQQNERSSEVNNFIEMHQLLPGLLPRLHQMCGKIFYFTTGGIVVENNILHKIILFYCFCFILFYFIYSIFNFVMLSLKMLGVIISVRFRCNDLLYWQMEQPIYSLLLIYCDRC